MPHASPSFLSFWRPVMALMIREMSTTYGRYPMGFIWLLLEPIAAILVLTIVFAYALRTPPIGDSFALFYASGYLPYIMYVETQKRVSSAIGFSRGLLRYPRVTILDALIARSILSLLTISIVSTIVIVAIMFIFSASTQIKYGEVFVVYALAFGFGFAVGTVNCFMFTRIRFWRPVWKIITRPLFLVSGIFYTYELLPPLLQKILWYNPLLHITGMARDAFYPGYEPTYTSILFVIGLIIVVLTVGLLLLSVLSRDFIEQ